MDFTSISQVNLGCIEIIFLMLNVFKCDYIVVIIFPHLKNEFYVQLSTKLL
jgi:hypothetical protein